MLAVRDHDVDDYATLLDMDATDVGVLTEDDRACLDELGEYLVASDAWRRFAIWLLHKHFEPVDGEVFVEHAIRARRKTETAPVKRSDFSEKGLNTTAVRFGTAVGSGVSVIGMEFAEPADFGSISPLGADDETVLASISERLNAHGKTNRFGIRLIRDPLGLSERELLLETCDSASRTLHCDVSSRDDIPGQLTVIETSWRWRLVDGESGPVVMQECTAGCIPVGDSHDLNHAHPEPEYDD